MAASSTQIRTPLPVYATGTVAGTAGSAVLAGTGTSWTTLDANGNTVNVVMGGDVFMTATGPIPIKSVDSATQVTLEAPLPATIAAGSTYRIIKYQANYSGGVTAALAALMQMGSDTSPYVSMTIDNGTSRLKLRVGAAGDLQIAVGTTGILDAALLTVFSIAQKGAALLKTVFSMSTQSATPAAPGPGTGSLFFVAGTNSGTLKLQAMAGTSTTPVTIADNIGSGA